MKDLFASGWKIIAPVNFQLPDDAVNPCAFSNYDVAPQISSEISNEKLIVTIKSLDQIQVSGRLFLDNNGDKLLVKSIESTDDHGITNLSLLHTLDLGSLDSTAIYELELTLAIPSRSVKVLKVYKMTSF